MKENIYTKRSLQLIQKTNIKEQQSKMLTSVSKYCRVRKWTFVLAGQ